MGSGNFQFGANTTHVADSRFLSGTVDGDALLSDLEVGQAYHFQAVFGDLSLISTQEIALALGENISIQGVVEPLVIPAGTQGFINKNDTGGLTVFYATSPESTVETATEVFTSTNGACVRIGDTYQSNPDGTTYKIPSTNETNEALNNPMPSQYITLSYEAVGGGSAIVNVNGQPATFVDTVNATPVLDPITNNPTGRINFSGGTNQVFDRLARVDGKVLENVGDYVEFQGVDVNSFSGVQIALVSDPNDLAHQTTNVYKLLVNAGQNGGNENYSFRGTDNAVIDSGAELNQTHRITKTIAGISYSVNGDERYCTNITDFIDYSNPTNLVEGNTGLYQVGVRHTDLTPIANTNDTVVATGHQLVRNTGQQLWLKFVDAADAHQWGVHIADVDDMFDRFDRGLPNLTSMTIFDNDFIIVMADSLADLEAGNLRITDNGREQSYCWSELYIKATDRNGSVVTAETTAPLVNAGFVVTFPAVIEEDPDNWKQTNNQEFVVPAGLDGRYLINGSISTAGADANSSVSGNIRINNVVISSDSDDNNTAGNRSVSLSAVANLVEGDSITLQGFAGDAQSLQRARLTITELNNLSSPTSSLGTENREDVLFATTNLSDGATGTLANGLTWQEVQDEYDEIFATLTYPNNAYSGRWKTDQLFDATAVLAVSIGADGWTQIEGIAASGNSFVHDTNGFTAAGDVTIYGVRAQQTVISDAELSITNPNDAGVLTSNEDGTATFQEQIICNPFSGQSGPIDINGVTNVPLEWTPNTLGDYTVEVTGINPVGANDEGHIRIGTTGVSSFDVLNGTGAADRFSNANGLTRQYTFTVTTLSLHTLTFGTGGGSAFENVTARIVDCPDGSLELPDFSFDRERPKQFMIKQFAGNTGYGAGPQILPFTEVASSSGLAETTNGITLQAGKSYEVTMQGSHFSSTPGSFVEYTITTNQSTTEPFQASFARSESTGSFGRISGLARLVLVNLTVDTEVNGLLLASNGGTSANMPASATLIAREI